ncbi:threonine/serine ThrE exporter family protein [Streptomyces boninensis]|uniref:threonine/serine ThrE exporter family protein n=1 Tax=Streptomyces boninensis TaxID=2039455 RepID=UPI003B2107D8
MPSKSLPWVQGALGRLRGLEPAEPPRPAASSGQRALQVSLMVGAALLKNGASAEETVAGMLACGEACGLTGCEIDVTLSQVSMCAYPPGPPGEAETRLVDSLVVVKPTNDFSALQRTHRVVADITAGRYALDEAWTAADAALHPPPAGSSGLPGLLQAAVIAAAGSMLAGGGPVAIVVSFAAAMVGALIVGVLGAYGMPAFHLTFLAVVPGSLAALVIATVQEPGEGQAVLVGAILALLPAMTMVSGVQDSLTGHHLTAISRFLDASLVFAAIVAGTATVLSIGKLAGLDLPPAHVQLQLDYLSWRTVGAVAFALAVAMRYRVPVRQWGYITLLVLGGAVVYVELREAGVARILAVACTALVVGAVGQLVARKTGVSALPAVLPAVAPLLPGALIYTALGDLVASRVEEGISGLVEALAVILAIAAGITTAGEAAFLIRRSPARRLLPPS